MKGLGHMGEATALVQSWIYHGSTVHGRYVPHHHVQPLMAVSWSGNPLILSLSLDCVQSGPLDDGSWITNGGREACCGRTVHLRRAERQELLSPFRTVVALGGNDTMVTASTTMYWCQVYQLAATENLQYR
ncbi:hypothetical protein FA15DRAFT_664725 [Coprinopsis marcescibilis]|uniref:Uncharacterized protein n=1 Tax=Coprinopsis marcescibilis TaxID=230819 RepID=A0A5C3L993_COPMA|nr:hypothetical protein FA15DRAFT_664725 [Coprinopsis marcescibilis]